MFACVELGILLYKKLLSGIRYPYLSSLSSSYFSLWFLWVFFSFFSLYAVPALLAMLALFHVDRFYRLVQSHDLIQ